MVPILSRWWMMRERQSTASSTANQIRVSRTLQGRRLIRCPWLILTMPSGIFTMPLLTKTFPAGQCSFRWFFKLKIKIFKHDNFLTSGYDIWWSRKVWVQSIWSNQGLVSGWLSSDSSRWDLMMLIMKGYMMMISLIGKITLNRNPRNYFAEVEQLAFSPAHLVPGIEPR